MNRLPLSLLLSLFLFSGCEKFDWGEKPDYREAYVGTYRVTLHDFNMAYNNSTVFDTVADVNFYYIKDEWLSSYMDTIPQRGIRMKYKNDTIPNHYYQGFQILKSGDLKMQSSTNPYFYGSGGFIGTDSIEFEFKSNDGGHYYRNLIIKGKKK